MKSQKSPLSNEALKKEIVKLQGWHDTLKGKIAELENRQEGLQEKEVYLKAIEATTESKSLLVKELTEQVDALKDEHAYLSKAIDRTRTDLTKEQVKQGDKLKELRQDTEKAEHKYETTRIRAIDQQKVLETLNKEIQNRKKYAEEQESLLDKTITDGNKMLYDLKYDIADAESKKTSAEHQLNQAQIELSDYIMLSDNTKSSILDDIEALNKVYQEKSTELQQLEKDIVERKAEYAEIYAENDRKIMILKEHEQKIKTLRDTVVKERAELETEKRRWHSLKNLYGDI